ncbi:hypothetical protein QOT17_022967 [Balamuthia mandrillaris]
MFDLTLQHCSPSFIIIILPHIVARLGAQFLAFVAGACLWLTIARFQHHLCFLFYTCGYHHYDDSLSLRSALSSLGYLAWLLLDEWNLPTTTVCFSAPTLRRYVSSILLDNILFSILFAYCCYNRFVTTTNLPPPWLYFLSFPPSIPYATLNPSLYGSFHLTRNSSALFFFPNTPTYRCLHFVTVAASPLGTLLAGTPLIFSFLRSFLQEFWGMCSSLVILSFLLVASLVQVLLLRSSLLSFLLHPTLYSFFYLLSPLLQRGKFYDITNLPCDEPRQHPLPDFNLLLS